MRGLDVTRSLARSLTKWVVSKSISKRYYSSSEDLPATWGVIRSSSECSLRRLSEMSFPIAVSLILGTDLFLYKHFIVAYSRMGWTGTDSRSWVCANVHKMGLWRYRCKIDKLRNSTHESPGHYPVDLCGLLLWGNHLWLTNKGQGGCQTMSTYCRLIKKGRS